MAEEYIESIIIRQDNRPEVAEPSFCDDCVDEEYEFEGHLLLKQIIKSVQNKTHNRHDYVFEIISVGVLQKQED